MSCSGHSQWHDDTLAQSLDCAEKQAPLFSLRPTWQCLELCWHLSFSFRTNPVALFTWGQGEGWGCHGNPCWWSDRALGERRAEGGAAGGSSASRSLSLSIILTPSNTQPSLSCRSVNLSLLLLRKLIAGFHFNLANKSVIKATNFQVLVFFPFKICPHYLFNSLSSCIFFSSSLCAAFFLNPA